MSSHEEDGLKPIGETVPRLPWMRTLASRVEPNVKRETFTERVLSLRDRLAHNDPDHRDPEKYHRVKREILHELEELAMERR